MLETLVAVIILLGIVIFVHELGHFLAARMFKVRVDVFSLGMGPRLFGVKRGDTDYRVSALPIGGYVKMAGESALADVTGAPDEFMSKPRWQRAIILVAGVTMNVVLAFMLLFGMFTLQGVPYLAYTDRPVEVTALPPGAAGLQAGLAPGDHIVQIGEVKTPTWAEAEEVVRTSTGDAFVLSVERDGKPLTINVSLGKDRRDEDQRWVNEVIGYAPMPPVIDQVVAGMPAAEAGLKADDQIVAVDGQPVSVWGQVQDRILGSHGRPLQFTVRRGTEELNHEVTPIQPPGRRVRWQIGMVNLFETRYRKQGIGEAAGNASEATVFTMGQIVRVVGGLVSGKVSIKELGGPIEIARQSGRAARRGVTRFIELMVMISLNLAVLNLLPIPILDGGHILMLGIEGLRRRDLSLAVKERFMQVGFVVLMLIFVFVMYNDVIRSFSKGN